MTTPDYADWQTHIAHADAIAATGVPLLSNATSLFAMTSLTPVPAGGSLVIPGGPFAINQIGYELSIEVLASAASLFPFCNLTLTWSDSVSGQTVAIDRYALAGANPTANPYMLTGPTKGDTVAVQVDNFDGTNTMGVLATMIQNSRVYVRDDMRNVSMQFVPGGSRGNYSLGAGVLLNTQVTVNAGASQSRNLGFYSGIVFVSFTGTAKYELEILGWNGEVNPTIGFPVFLEQVTTAGGGPIQGVCTLPRCFCQLSIINQDTVNGSFSGSVIISEQQP